MAQTGRIRVFLLDDHEMLRRGVRDLLLEAGGFEVAGESSSTEEALRRMPRCRPEVAIIGVRNADGSDDGTGSAACRAVRNLGLPLRILLVTALDTGTAWETAAAAGADAAVPQRIPGPALVDAVRRLAAGRTPLATPAPAASSDARLAALTGQENRVLGLIADGLTNRQIGEHLGIGENTVKHYVASVLRKLGLARRTQAAVLGARRRGS